MSKNFSPREIVSELDRFIIGQHEAKRAVAVALRNRWRRQQLDDKMREEIMPKNILMIGPTGVGKTEISRRLAKLANAPFIKVEATKFTEVGYVGRDVEQIIRDLLENAILLVKEKKRETIKTTAQLNAENTLIDILVGKTASEVTKDSFKRKLRDGELNEKEVEIKISKNNNTGIDVPLSPGSNIGVINMSEILGEAFGKKSKKIKTTVQKAQELLINDEAEKLLNQDEIVQEAIKITENNGIVFLDEIDKIAVKNSQNNSGISREGVQRDLLPLVEGTNVATKYGQVKTDHILFIASGAFHVAKPSDLLPELQGRLPIRVELNALKQEDFKKILTEPETSLIKQAIALLKTENVTLKITDEAIDEFARLAVSLNNKLENIGARRLHTVLEKVLDEISFTAPDKSGTEFVIDADYVTKIMKDISEDVDLSRFIL
ncbi:ATP-dependent protease ATPase subunit HslU [Bartonella sp. DGB1]|uniref:ATP-dependent protease ATPase subunit HslU n=1 Tax=Bartonella sp. DGB1 TaxID=3239807 RepID=UPI003524F862